MHCDRQPCKGTMTAEGKMICEAPDCGWPFTTAPATCPDCQDETDCSNAPICRAVEEI